MRPLSECRLYAFVDAAYLHGRKPVQVAEELCEGGADLIQLRAKDWPLEQIRRAAEQILPICESANVGLVINDHPQVAVEVGAPVCHLGQEDFFDGGHADRRTVFPAWADTLLGLSTHRPEQAVQALRAGANYLAIGPVYATGTKPGAQPVGLEYVRWAAREVPVPWFAIGGITLENLPKVVEAGATRVAVVSAILNSKQVVRACQAFRKLIA